MSNKSAIETELHQASVKLFARKRSRLADLPALRTLVTNFAPGATAVIGEVAGMTVTATVVSISQEAAAEFAALSETAVAVRGWIPEWNELAICQFDKTLLIRALDAMYGGEPGTRTQAPKRALTSLEQSLSALLGGALLKRLAATLGDVCPFTVQSERYVDESDLAMLSKKQSDYLVVRLRIVEYDDSVALAIPLIGLEGARDRLTVPKADTPADIDPAWAKAFRRNIASTPIHVTASAAGPDMLLSDVAGLHPGSTLELDGSQLRNVLIEGEERPVFTGRLGQSKGMFAISIERPVGPPSLPEDVEQ